jgi:transposase
VPDRSRRRHRLDPIRVAPLRHHHPRQGRDRQQAADRRQQDAADDHNERSRPLVAALETWLREQRRNLSARNDVAKAIHYSLNRWVALTRFLDDGRLCMSNNAAERALRCVAVGRHNWTFAGSDEGGRRAAAIYTLVETAKLNDVDPQAWLADVLARLQDHPAKRIDELLPWNWKRTRQQKAAACAPHSQSMLRCQRPSPRPSPDAYAELAGVREDDVAALADVTAWAPPSND